MEHITLKQMVRNLQRRKACQKNGANPASPFKEGQMDYLIPNVMYEAEPTKCIVRIAGKEVKKAVMQISKESDHQSIMITDEMSVRLVDVSGGKDFTIVSNNTEKQSIDAGQFTEWNFNVTPRKPRKGSKPQYTLSLNVTLHFANKKKDLPLIEKSIHVKKGKDDLTVPKHVVFTAADIETGLNLINEAKNIQSIRARAKEKAKFTFTKVLNLNILKLMDILLKENPSILHYSGHSQLAGIYLFGQDNLPKMASTEDLVELFDSVKDKLKIECFILNSCFSGSQANALKNYTKYIVGTTQKIANLDAVLFSEIFYEGIFNGLDYRDAFKLALAGLKVSLRDPTAAEIYNFQPAE
ncbi:MAG TPA: hypothetical protein VMZ69_11175 [Saprospiraceae bacterium]|nr:hypothetical protein [Saprospiraceae bacterium]